MAERFQYLFTPLRIRDMTVRNRIVSTPHGTCLASPDFLPSEAQVYYYAERAKGGVGMIVMGASFVHPSSPLLPGCNRSDDERSIPGFRQVARAVHAHGARMIGQLDHLGSYCISELSEHPLWAPSVLPYPKVPELAHEIETEGIGAVIRGAAQAAHNFVEGEFDGVEIMLGGPFLFPSFLSPATNRRQDAYGGDLEGRLRFVYQLIDRVREAVGNDRVVGVRVNGDEFTAGGLTLEEMVQIAPKLEATGKIDYIHVRTGFIESKHLGCPDLHTPLGAFVYLAAGIKEALQEIPVCTVTRINDPVHAERILADGHADLIGMNRATIADPEMPRKAQEGRLEEIRACVGCNQGCIERVLLGFPIRCVQNPAAGREKELGIGTLRPTARRKRVLVVGGGPAGMEAARVVAERGHRVILYEAQGELGGQVAVAARAPQREEFGGITRYLSLQLARLGVEVRLGAAATLETVAGEAPEVVVIATGSRPAPPDLPGINQENVVEAQAVLRGEAAVGERVLVVDDGEGYWKGCGTAEMLALQGKQVLILTPDLYVGARIDHLSLDHLYQRLGEMEVSFIPHRVLKAISGKRVLTQDVYSGKEIEIEGIDTVVWAGGYRAEDGLYRALQGQVRELHAVGDCMAPRRVRDAIREGHLAGRAV